MSSSDDFTHASRSDGPAAPVDAAFTPGQVLAGRYRMIGVLGRGGMGEVYRADDLKLGTPVALKFLPRHVQHDPVALRRFHDEVRIARQVSHPHVCRVFDIVEVEGRHFISMEYVDGEDLSTLLRRIGRLPPAKAVELARQVCAGLHAAHQQGVLHRDLKPANIMVDGHGRARITDFGLAVTGSTPTTEFAGTPAYMAPEQLAGGAASTQSDLYALGLVLFEMFTGTRAFEATTLDGWRQAHLQSQPPRPSSQTGDMDPAVERVILRCLEKDPKERPASVSQVAYALPGGDPLAAAMAEGVTPSPAMVAAAGGEGVLAPRHAWALLAVFLLCLVGLVAIAPYSTDAGIAPMTRSPEVLLDRARSLVRELGVNTPARDETWWLERDYDLLRWLADHMASTTWRSRLRSLGAPVLLTHRRTNDALTTMHPSRLITADVPPAVNGSGDVRVVVDAEGRLREYLAAPSARAGTPSERITTDIVFRATGLDAARFAGATPERTPPVAFDRREEWVGTRAQLPELSLRLAVAWFEGRIVWAAVLGPWQESGVERALDATAARLKQLVLSVMILGVLAIGIVFGQRNLRAGRGDRRGAFTIAVVMASLATLLTMLTTHVAPDVTAPVDVVFGTLNFAVVDGATMWLLYIAVEPYARRHAPELLVGWARLLEGRFSDAGVGRDVLIGVATGAGLALLSHIMNALPALVDLPAQTPIPGFTFTVPGAGVLSRLAPVGAVVSAVHDAVMRSLWSFVVVIVARLFVRARVAAVLTGALFVLLGLGGENLAVETTFAVLIGTTLAWVANYRGLLAFTSTWTVYTLLVSGVTLGVGVSTWYGPVSWAMLAVLVGLGTWAFRCSLGGRPAFTTLAVEDPRAV